MGAAIISAIQSGLGLMSDLAGEFLEGFTTLFWDATANTGAGALTVFGQYSLVMLGISITFAVIALVFNVLRSNTGV